MKKIDFFILVLLTFLISCSGTFEAMPQGGQISTTSTLSFNHQQPQAHDESRDDLITIVGYPKEIKLEPMPGHIVGLKSGEPTPYDGVLLSMEAGSWLLTLNDQFEERLLIERRFVFDMTRAHYTKLINDERIRSNADMNILQTQYDTLNSKLRYNLDIISEFEKRENDFWNQPSLYGIVGFASGIGITLLTIYTINQF